MALNWGAVAVGGASGIGVAVALGIPVLAVFGADGFAGPALLILAQFVGQSVAGFTAGRFVRADHAVHGGLAAEAAFAVTGGVAIAVGRDPALATLAFSAVVALVLGSAGGVLAAAWARRR
ncbi:MAG: hypothetical protein KQH83_05630 [Actinobacteria bacterium]|nr:hypothetical protein [Actinomycetota bacterium]